MQNTYTYIHICRSDFKDTQREFVNIREGRFLFAFGQYTKIETES